MLLVEFHKSQIELFNEIKEKFGPDVQLGTKITFSGYSDGAIAIVTISTAITPFLTKVIIELIKNKRRVKLKYKGFEIDGVSEDTVKEIIENLGNSDNAN